jgi:hypothetical protein
MILISLAGLGSMSKITNKTKKMTAVVLKGPGQPQPKLTSRQRIFATPRLQFARFCGLYHGEPSSDFLGCPGTYSAMAGMFAVE